MKDELFDRKIRESVESFQADSDSGLWDSISGALARKRKWMFIKRVSLYGASVAAVLLGVFMIMSPDNEGRLSGSSDLSVLPGEQLSQVVVEEDVLPSQEPLNEDYVVVLQQEVQEVQEVPHKVAADIPVSPAIIAESINENFHSGESFDEELTENKVAKSSENESSPEEDSEYWGVGEELLADDEYFQEELSAPRAKRRPITVSAGGNVSMTGPESAYNFVPGPSFNVGGGHGVKDNHSVTPTSAPNHYFPVSVGVNLSYSFLNDKLSVGIGLNYTYLFSRYEALVDRRYNADVEQSVHYIGIPVNFYYNIIGNEYLTFYANAGGMLERGLRTDYDITTFSGEKMDRYTEPKGVQWSVNAGIGLEYRFINFMGVYLEPRITYYFTDGLQPLTVRSEQPLQFNLELGFRFHI